MAVDTQDHPIIDGTINMLNPAVVGDQPLFDGTYQVELNAPSASYQPNMNMGAGSINNQLDPIQISEINAPSTDIKPPQPHYGSIIQQLSA